MFEHRVGTLIVLKNFGVKDTKLVSVVLGYQTVNNFYELYETGQVLCDTHRSFDDKIKVLKVRPYDQDTWQEYLSTMGFVPEVVYCYIAVEEDTVLNKYFYPYKYQFNDTIVLKKDIPKGIAYTIHKFSWVGKHPIGSKKRQ